MGRFAMRLGGMILIYILHVEGLITTVLSVLAVSLPASC